MTYPKILLNQKPRTLAELYTNYTRWTQGAAARNSADESLVAVNQPCATRWCLSGAVSLVYGPTGEADILDRLRAVLQAELPETSIDEKDEETLENEAEPFDLVSWNDHPGRTFKEIRRLIIKAGV